MPATLLNSTQTQLVALAKGHYGPANWETLGKLYSKVYEYDPNTSGIYHFVAEVFWVLWKAQGCNTDQLDRVLEDSLPSKVWRVGVRGVVGPGDEAALRCRALSMFSYIRLTPGQYFAFDVTTEHHLPFEGECGKFHTPQRALEKLSL